MDEIIDHYNEVKNRKVILVGYDWGGAIAMRYLSSKNGVISQAILFHPSWTLSYDLLTKINIKVTLLWVTTE